MCGFFLFFLSFNNFLIFAAKITEADIQRVANRMLRSKPSVAGYGSLGQLPRYEDIESGLTTKDGKMPRRFLLFR
jgi:processing peptidase subunit alpha